MYTSTNFKTKKQFKEAVAAGKKITVYQPNSDLFGGSGDPPKNGKVAIEGPWYPQPHVWYATATLKDGVVVKVS